MIKFFLRLIGFNDLSPVVEPQLQASPIEFKYRDCVRVRNGFYEGQLGIVVNYGYMNQRRTRYYTVNLSGDVQIDLYASQLALVLSHSAGPIPAKVKP